MFEQTLDVEHPFGHHDAMHRTGVRRRRLTLLLGSSILVALVTGPVAHAFSGPDHARVRHYVVRRGDTLWSIAHAVQPGSDPRAVIEIIQRSNGLAGDSIVPGERLTVPAAA
jgi:nucleoid-associated protein YgaU